MRFGEYLKKNIWEPLGFKDTFFAKPDNTGLERLAQQYIGTDDGIVPMEQTCNYQFTENYESGGAGLVSCTEDYAKLADTIACGGESADGVRILKPETIDIADEPVSLHRQPGTEKQPRVIRSATAGLAAVAAVFALIFGGIALKLHRDNTGIEASLPGTVITDISVTEVTGTDLAALTVAPTGEFTTIVTTTEMLSFTPIENPIPQQPDESVSAGETNFLGGKGLLRPVTAEGEPCILQDDEYIYLYGSEKVRKTGLDALREPNPELICQT